MALSNDSDIVPSIHDTNEYGEESALLSFKIFPNSSSSSSFFPSSAKSFFPPTIIAQPISSIPNYEDNKRNEYTDNLYKSSEQVSQGGGTGGSDDQPPSLFLFSSLTRDQRESTTTTTPTLNCKNQSKMENDQLNTSSYSSNNTDHHDPWITLSPTVYTTNLPSTGSSSTPLPYVVTDTTTSTVRETDPKGLLRDTITPSKTISSSLLPLSTLDYVPSPIPPLAMTKKLTEGSIQCSSLRSLTEINPSTKDTVFSFPSELPSSSPVTTHVDILPREGIVRPASHPRSYSSSSTASDISSIPGGSSTVTALRMEIEALRLECEERAFSTLEMQRNHAKEMDNVRKLLNEKMTENGNLRNQVSHTGNKAIAAVLAQDELEKRSKEEISILKLRLNQMQEERDSLLHSLQSGMMTNSTALSESQQQCTLLQKQLEQYQHDQQHTKETIKQLHKRNIDLQADNQLKETTIRTLQNQVSTFIQREGEDTSRAEIAETECTRLNQELDKRLKQLHRLIEAVDRARVRETTTSAAMEAQNASLLQLQAGLTAANAEADRWREAVDTLQARHDETVDEAERWREEVEKLREERDIEREAIENATKSSDAVKALSQALDLAREENLSLTNQLTKVCTETRKEINTLSRKCEEQQGIITGLQSDLQASTKGSMVPLFTPSSLMFSTSAPASSAASIIQGNNQYNDDKNGMFSLNEDLHPHDAEELMENDPIVSGSIVHGSITSKSIPHRSSKLVHLHPAANSASTELLHSLRLQCESLSRKLQAKEDRLREMAKEQEALFDVNERLRCALETAQNTIVAEEKRSATIPGLDNALQHAQSIRDRYNRYVRAANVNMTNEIEANDIAIMMDKHSNSSIHSSSVASIHPLSNDIKIPDSVSKEILEYIQQVEDVFFTTGGMLRSTHGLLSLLRAHIDGDEGIMDEYYRGSNGTRNGNKTKYYSTSSSSDMLLPLGGGDIINHSYGIIDSENNHSNTNTPRGYNDNRNSTEYSFPEETILISRLARVRVPLQQHLLQNLGKTTMQPTGNSTFSSLPLQLTNPVLLRSLIMEAIQGLTDIRMELQDKMAQNMSNHCITQ